MVKVICFIVAGTLFVSAILTANWICWLAAALPTTVAIAAATVGAFSIPALEVGMGLYLLRWVEK